jgi:hypothetical protein
MLICLYRFFAFVPSWFIKQTHTPLGLLHFTSLLDFHFFSSHNILQHSFLPFFSVIHLEHLDLYSFSICPFSSILTANPPYDMSRTQDPAEDPYMQSRDMSSLLDSEPTIQERITSQPDQIDDGTPPFYTESNPPETPNSSSDYEDEKVSYNGPSTTHIVMLRVSKESSARPMPQAAFFNHNKALAFSTRILLQWCDAHYDDYVWKGPESLRGGLMKRYAAYHAQTGQQLAVADVIKVSIFDAKETEGIVKGEDEEEGSGEYGEEEDDEHRHKEQFGEGPHEEYFEERSDEDQDDSGKLPAANALRPKD